MTNMEGIFDQAAELNLDPGQWMSSEVTNMEGMLLEAAEFNQDIGTWDTS